MCKKVKHCEEHQEGTGGYTISSNGTVGYSSGRSNSYSWGYSILLLSHSPEGGVYI